MVWETRAPALRERRPRWLKRYWFLPHTSFSQGFLLLSSPEQPAWPQPPPPAWGKPVSVGWVLNWPIFIGSQGGLDSTTLPSAGLSCTGRYRIPSQIRCKVGSLDWHHQSLLWTCWPKNCGGSYIPMFLASPLGGPGTLQSSETTRSPDPSPPFSHGSQWWLISVFKAHLTPMHTRSMWACSLSLPFSVTILISQTGKETKGGPGLHPE